MLNWYSSLKRTRLIPDQRSPWCKLSLPPKGDIGDVGPRVGKVESKIEYTARRHSEEKCVDDATKLTRYIVLSSYRYRTTSICRAALPHPMRLLGPSP